MTRNDRPHEVRGDRDPGDRRDRVHALRHPDDGLPPESLHDLAHLLANVILRRRRNHHETTLPPFTRRA